MPNLLNSPTDTIPGKANANPVDPRPSEPFFRGSLSGTETIPQNANSLPYDPRPSASYYGSLSGPDTIYTDRASVPTGPQPRVFNGSLSGPDNPGVSSGDDTGINAHSTGSLSGPDTSRGTTYYGGGSMGTATPYPFDPLSPYYFPYQGPMSEEVMHRYLDKAILVSYISTMGNYPGATGPDYDPAYQALTDGSDAYMLYGATIVGEHGHPNEHGRDLNALISAQPKFIGGMATFWNAPAGWYLDWVCQTFKNDAAFFHSFDPEIICQFDESENIPYANEGTSPNGDGNRVTIPSSNPTDPSYNPRVPDLIGMFYGSDPRVVSPDNAGDTFFDFTLMRYQGSLPSGITYLPPCTPTLTTGCQSEYNPDITQAETRMWYYYLATRFIDAGCECIHMGDIEWYLRVDSPANGNYWYWDLLQKIRAYAKLYARRGMVLLDAHSFTLLPDTYTGLNDVYYLPSGTTRSGFSQLLHDFQNLGIIYTNYEGICSDGVPVYSGGYLTGYEFGTANQPAIIEPPHLGLITNSWPGYNPQGWYCAHNPYLLHLDNGTLTPPFGCSVTWLPDYGYDQTTWFANQKNDVQVAILGYTYYRIKCLDPYGHFQMPGRIVISLPGIDNNYTTPITVNHFILPQIQGFFIYNIFSGPSDWVYHNFLYENVSHGTNNCTSSLIFVGDDKMYFIGSDGWVNGFVKINGDYNDGTWVSVEPSAVAGGIQVPPKNEIVASPDGTMILYIGTDNNIYGLNIIDIWTYTYFPWSDICSLDPAIVPDRCLIFPGNEQIYYIGINRYNGHYQVHGFQKSSGSWVTVSPTYSAGVADIEFTPSGALTYDKRPDNDRIYYTALESGSLIAFFIVYSLIDYGYGTPVTAAYPTPDGILLMNNISILGNLAIYTTETSAGPATYIYFVGYRPVTGVPEIFLLQDDDTGWNIVSLSDNAVSAIDGEPDFGVYARWDGMISVSTDGTTVAYFGINNFVYFFKVGWPFVYIDSNVADTLPFPFTIPTDGAENTNSLQFTSNTDVYYCSSAGWLHHLKYQEAYCENPLLSAYPNPLL